VKRTMGLTGIGFFVVSMVLMSCAPVQKTIVTQGDLPALKGTWSGWTTFQAYMNRSVLTTLEINNATVPLQGKVIFHKLPGVVAFVMPIPPDAKSVDNSVTVKFKDGTISDKGTLIGTDGENSIELTYYGEKKQKFDGSFYAYGLNGKFTVTKE
jgi:hypothetical protein